MVLNDNEIEQETTITVFDKVFRFFTSLATSYQQLTKRDSRAYTALSGIVSPEILDPCAEMLAERERCSDPVALVFLVDAQTFHAWRRLTAHIDAMRADPRLNRETRRRLRESGLLD